MLRCDGCGCTSGEARGWMAFLGQDPPDEEWPFEWPFPAFYCPVCVEERFAVKRGAATYT